MGFKILTVFNIQIMALWDVTPCSLADGCHWFGDHAASVLRVGWSQQVSEKQFKFTRCVASYLIRLYLWSRTDRLLKC
jgi:hypothetical protein